MSQEVKEATLDNPSVNDELDTPTSIASAMTSTNESSTETDTPQQTDTEVPDFKLGHTLSAHVSTLCYDDVVTRWAKAPDMSTGH